MLQSSDSKLWAVTTGSNQIEETAALNVSVERLKAVDCDSRFQSDRGDSSLECFSRATQSCGL